MAQTSNAQSSDQDELRGRSIDDDEISTPILEPREEKELLPPPDEPLLLPPIEELDLPAPVPQGLLEERVASTRDEVHDQVPELAAEAKKKEAKEVDELLKIFNDPKKDLMGSLTVYFDVHFKSSFSKEKAKIFMLAFSKFLKFQGNEDKKAQLNNLLPELKGNIFKVAIITGKKDNIALVLDCFWNTMSSKILERLDKFLKDEEDMKRIANLMMPSDDSSHIFQGQDCMDIFLKTDVKALKAIICIEKKSWEKFSKNANPAFMNTLINEFISYPDSYKTFILTVTDLGLQGKEVIQRLSDEFFGEVKYPEQFKRFFNEYLAADTDMNLRNYAGNLHLLNADIAKIKENK